MVIEDTPEELAKLKRYNIYIELDCILDTKLALAMHLDEDSTVKFFQENKYTTRIRNNIGNISADIIDTLWRHRTKGILQLALPTPIMEELVREMYYEVISDPALMSTIDPVIYVNYYPYNLNEEEIKNLSIILGRFVRSTQIKMISLSKEELTTKWVSDNVGSVIMLEGLQWLEYQNSIGNVLKHPITDRLMITPPIISLPSSNVKISNDLFKAISDGYRTIINVQFIDVRYFSSYSLNDYIKSQQDKKNEDSAK